MNEELRAKGAELLIQGEILCAEMREHPMLTRDNLRRAEELIEALKMQDRAEFVAHCDEVFAKYRPDYDALFTRSDA